MTINVGRTTLASGQDKRTYNDSVTYEAGTELQLQFQQYAGPGELIVQRPDLLRVKVEILGNDPSGESVEKGWYPVASGEDAPDLDTEFLIETFTLPAQMGRRMRGGNVRAVITRPDTYFAASDYRVRVGHLPTKTVASPKGKK